MSDFCRVAFEFLFAFLALFRLASLRSLLFLLMTLTELFFFNPVD
uniref:Uncharacterized protein n=1 Tax=Vibrio tasmaniensis TaxID=212663 RepID=A0A0H3ZU11_9VIBR|nr:hypothetical protein [Vibrio tasmaniensis]